MFFVPINHPLPLVRHVTVDVQCDRRVPNHKRLVFLTLHAVNHVEQAVVPNERRNVRAYDRPEMDRAERPPARQNSKPCHNLPRHRHLTQPPKLLHLLRSVYPSQLTYARLRG